jgi:hypothetical protein
MKQYKKEEKWKMPVEVLEEMSKSRMSGSQHLRALS